MGGFSLGQPGLANEPITGDSLTQYLRSLTNAGGSTAQQFMGQGAGIIGQGNTQLSKAFDTTMDPMAYWQAILRGDPKALTAATAPTANALSSIYSGAMSGESSGLPAGGYRSSSLAQLPQAQASQVGNYLLGLQPTAATNLNSIAGTQAGIGSATGQLGLGTAGIGSNMLAQILQALNTRRGQNMTQDTANMGMLTSGLESLVSAGGGIGAKILSDVLSKEGLIKIGDVKGLPVYVFRYIGDDEVRMGVIAQEAREIVPEAVSEGTDHLLRVDYDLLFRRLELEGPMERAA